jgi:hypothetical protein
MGIGCCEMTLTIELSSEIEARLQLEANPNGVDSTEHARRLIESHLPGTGGAALADLMHSWIEEDATDDAEEINAREAELQEFKARMNSNRAATGERPVY